MWNQLLCLSGLLTVICKKRRVTRSALHIANGAIAAPFSLVLLPHQLGGRYRYQPMSFDIALFKTTLQQLSMLQCVKNLPSNQWFLLAAAASEGHEQLQQIDKQIVQT